jgi:hypothetical protein
MKKTNRIKQGLVGLLLGVATSFGQVEPEPLETNVVVNEFEMTPPLQRVIDECKPGYTIFIKKGDYNIAYGGNFIIDKDLTINGGRVGQDITLVNGAINTFIIKSNATLKLHNFHINGGAYAAEYIARAEDNASLVLDDVWLNTAQNFIYTDTSGSLSFRNCIFEYPGRNDRGIALDLRRFGRAEIDRNYFWMGGDTISIGREETEEPYLSILNNTMRRADNAIKFNQEMPKTIGEIANNIISESNVAISGFERCPGIQIYANDVFSNVSDFVVSPTLQSTKGNKTATNIGLNYSFDPSFLYGVGDMVGFFSQVRDKGIPIPARTTWFGYDTFIGTYMPQLLPTLTISPSNDLVNIVLRGRVNGTVNDLQRKEDKDNDWRNIHRFTEDQFTETNYQHNANYRLVVTEQ